MKMWPTCKKIASSISALPAVGRVRSQGVPQEPSQAEGEEKGILTEVPEEKAAFEEGAEAPAENDLNKESSASVKILLTITGEKPD